MTTLTSLGVHFLPGWMTLDDAPVGGLSGIDFDEAFGRWVLVTDDRSSEFPARAYDAAIEVGESGFGDVSPARSPGRRMDRPIRRCRNPA